MTSAVSIVNGLISFYDALILIYVVMSWFRPTGLFWEVFHVIGTVVEPFIGLFRRIMPNTGMIDFSPLAAILVLQYLIRPLLLILVTRL
jgi:YggT family protein